MFLQRPIDATYPSENGKNDCNVKTLGVSFSPTGVDVPNNEPLHIIWTSTTPPVKGQQWIANHLVALALLDVVPTPANARHAGHSRNERGGD